MVARRFGFSIWLITWDAASIPNWTELISMDVSGGDVNLANKELLKEIIDKSLGITKSISIHALSNATANKSSLTRMAVGRFFV